MKTTKTGKPRCNQCLRTATHLMTAHTVKNGHREPFYIYHCDNHITRYDKPLEEQPSLAQEQSKMDKTKITEQLNSIYSVTIDTETGQLDITGWGKTWGMGCSTAEKLRDFLNKTLPTTDAPKEATKTA